MVLRWQNRDELGNLAPENPLISIARIEIREISPESFKKGFDCLKICKNAFDKVKLAIFIEISCFLIKNT